RRAPVGRGDGGLLLRPLDRLLVGLLRGPGPRLPRVPRRRPLHGPADRRPAELPHHGAGLHAILRALPRRGGREERSRLRQGLEGPDHVAHRRARRVDSGHPGEDRDGLRREGLRPARAHRDRGVGVRVRRALRPDPRQRGLLLSRDPRRAGPAGPARRARRPAGEAGRRSAHGARDPRHRRDRGGRVASALGPQGPARSRRPDGGAVLKAALFREHGGAEKILYEDYRDPVVSPAEVLVRVKACALNHVDMLLLDGRFPPPEGLPHVNGCEVTGTIEATGAEVTGLRRGQRVVVFPGFACGRCEYCLRGERTVCVYYGYLGAHKDGGYAELVKAPAANIVPLPEALAFEAGAA